MQELKQSDINKIINTYSIRKDEFTEVSQFCFQSTLVKGYMISLSLDPDGRVLVSHTQDNGKRTYVDVWERSNDKLIFKFRNPWNQPLSDAEYIKDLEKQINDLKAAGAELQERLNNVGESHKLITATDADTKTETRPKNERGAGRKPSHERLNAIAITTALLLAGRDEEYIMNELKISRATFYRYKRMSQIN